MDGFIANAFGLMETKVRCVWCGHPLAYLCEEDFLQAQTFCLHCDIYSYADDDGSRELPAEEKEKRRA